MLTASRAVCRTSSKCIGCNGRGCKSARARVRTHTLLLLREPAMLPRLCEPAFVSPRHASCSLRRTVLQVRCSLIGLQNAAQPRPLQLPIQHSPFAAVFRRRPCRRDPIALSSGGAARHLQRRVSRRRRVACHARILAFDGWRTHQLCTVLARHAWCNGHIQLEEACSRDACSCNGHLLEQSSCSLQCAACFCRPAAMSVSQSSVNSGTLASVARTQPDGTMLRATATCPSKGLAAFKVARCCAATAMLAAQSSFCQRQYCRYSKCRAQRQHASCRDHLSQHP